MRPNIFGSKILIVIVLLFGLFIVFSLYDCRRRGTAYPFGVEIGVKPNPAASYFYLTAEHSETSFPFPFDHFYDSTFYRINTWFFKRIINRQINNVILPSSMTLTNYSDDYMKYIAYQITITSAAGDSKAENSVMKFTSLGSRFKAGGNKAFTYNDYSKNRNFIVNFPKVGPYNIHVDLFYNPYYAFPLGTVKEIDEVKAGGDWKHLYSFDQPVNVIHRPDVEVLVGDLRKFVAYTQTQPDNLQRPDKVKHNGEIESHLWGSVPYAMCIFEKPHPNSTTNFISGTGEYSQLRIPNSSTALSIGSGYSEYKVYMKVRKVQNKPDLNVKRLNFDVDDESSWVSNPLGTNLMTNFVTETSTGDYNFDNWRSRGSVDRFNMEQVNIDEVNGVTEVSTLSNVKYGCNFDFHSKDNFLKNEGNYQLQYVAKRVFDGREFKSPVYEFVVLDDRLDFDIVNIGADKDTVVNHWDGEDKRELNAVLQNAIRPGLGNFNYAQELNHKVIDQVEDPTDREHKRKKAVVKLSYNGGTKDQLRYLRSNSIGVFKDNGANGASVLDEKGTNEKYPDMKKYQIKLKDPFLNGKTAKRYKIKYHVDLETINPYRWNKYENQKEKKHLVKLWLPATIDGKEVQYSYHNPDEDHNFLKYNIAGDGRLSDAEKTFDIYVSSLLNSAIDKEYVNNSARDLVLIKNISVTITNEITGYSVTKNLGSILRVRTLLELDGKWNRFVPEYGEKVSKVDEDLGNPWYVTLKSLKLHIEKPGTVSAKSGDVSENDQVLMKLTNNSSGTKHIPEYRQVFESNVEKNNIYTPLKPQVIEIINGEYPLEHNKYVKEHKEYNWLFLYNLDWHVPLKTSDGKNLLKYYIGLDVSVCKYNLNLYKLYNPYDPKSNISKRVQLKFDDFPKINIHRGYADVQTDLPANKRTAKTSIDINFSNYSDRKRLLVSGDAYTFKTDNKMGIAIGKENPNENKHTYFRMGTGGSYIDKASFKMTYTNGKLGDFTFNHNNSTDTRNIWDRILGNGGNHQDAFIEAYGGNNVETHDIIAQLSSYLGWNIEASNYGISNNPFDRNKFKNENFSLKDKVDKNYFNNIGDKFNNCDYSNFINKQFNGVFIWKENSMSDEDNNNFWK